MKCKTILEQNSLRIWFILIFVWGFSFYIRLQYIPFVEINSDSLSPYLSALKFWTVGFPPPPNPESDHWMWISKAPWLWCASSLEGLFQIRFLIGASIAPMAAWCVWYSTHQYRHISALACGLLVALDKGLIDTLISSFRGYMAPEWISLATCFFVLSRTHKWTLPLVAGCVVIAGGHHPMALGALLGVAWLCFAKPKQSWKLITAVILFGFFRCLSLYEILQCDAGGWACIQTIALGSTEDMTFVQLVLRIVHDRFWVEMGWACIVLLFGFILSPKDDAWLWCVSSCVGVIVLGLIIDTLRPYHFRALSVPILLVSIHGLQRCQGWIYPIFGLWIFGLWYSSADIVGVEDSIRLHDQAGKEIQDYSDIWMESSKDGSIFIPGVGLSATLSGFPPQSFSTHPQDTILMFIHSPVPKKYRISDLGDTVLWGGGHDWATSIYSSDSVHSVVP